MEDIDESDDELVSCYLLITFTKEDGIISEKALVEKFIHGTFSIDMKKQPVREISLFLQRYQWVWCVQCRKKNI